MSGVCLFVGQVEVEVKHRSTRQAPMTQLPTRSKRTSMSRTDAKSRELNPAMTILPAHHSNDNSL
jgi:hypothetical protein